MPSGRDQHRIRELEHEIARLKDQISADWGGRQGWEALFAAHPRPMLIFDQETLGILEVNDAAVDHYGWSRDEFLAMTIKDIRPAEDVARLLETTARPPGGLDRAGIWRHHLKDGTVIDVEIVSHALRYRGRAAELVHIRDVTDVRRSLEALARSEQHFKTLSEVVPVGVFHTDADGLALSVNGRWCEMTGMAAEAAKGRGWVGALHPDDQERVTTVWRQTARGRRSFREEYRVRRPDGTVIPVLGEARAIEDASGEVRGYVGAITDLSEIRDLEGRLLQAQKLESIGRLAGGVAHDFNNLLTAIQGHLELARPAVPEDSPLAEHLEAIGRAGDRAKDLTRQLLAFARRQVIRPVPCDLDELIAASLELLRRLIGEDVRVSFRPAGGVWPVEVDPGQLQQVLMNLAVNARDAMPDGGHLTLETANVTLDAEAAAARPEVLPGDYVCVSVSDTGRGMTPAVRERLFEPFFTTKEVGKGTGLGLATVHGIVRQSGGHIWVDSEVGRGSTFRIYLPRVEAPVAERREPVAAALAPRGDETILVVEDEAALRDLLRIGLGRLGYDVQLAADAEEALARIHGGLVPAVVVTDVVMPGMSGRRLADELHRSRPDLPVLFVSGYTENAIVHHGVLEEGVRFLAKPYTPIRLARELRSMLDG